MSSTPPMRRPGGVTFLVILLWAQALLGIAGGIALIVLRDDGGLLHDTGRSPDTLLAWGIGAVVLGLITACVAPSLGRGNNTVRWLVGAVALLHLLGGLATIIRLQHAGTETGAIADVVAALIVIYILFAEDSTEAYFSGRGSTAHPHQEGT
jgi:hypothetical protein